MNKYYRLVLNLIFALGLLTGAQVASALEQYFDQPFSETLVCETSDGNSEQIYIEGTYRVQLQFVEGAAHTTSLFQIFWTAEGYGLTSGAEYLLRGKWMEVIQENPPYIVLWNDHFRLIGKGRAENFDTYFKVRMVVNPNGELTVNFVDSAECEQV